MNTSSGQLGFDFHDGKKLSQVHFFQEVIIDRGSKYSVFGAPVNDAQEIKDLIRNLKRQPYFSKATHNSYAYRIETPTGILEGKNDDGETGAGMCILREIQRKNASNIVIVVTRYFGGTLLQNDRFKHVIDAVKIFFERADIG